MTVVEKPILETPNLETPILEKPILREVRGNHRSTAGVHLVARDYPRGMRIDLHMHREAQLIYAAKGTMQVNTPEGRWLVPPDRAVWVPAGLQHAIDLLADIEIRKRSGNRLGLQDAMRGVLAAGGNHEKDWTLARVLSTADQAVGGEVLTHLHDEMGPKPVTPDLAALWQDLGVKMQGETVAFDDTAPLASIRKAITEPRAP